MVIILGMQFQKTYRHSLVNNPIQFWNVSRKLLWWEKNENGCSGGVNTYTKLGKTATNNCISSISVLQDVSNDGHSRTHIVDSKQAFDKNYVLNSRDNVTHISCMMGVANESNHSNSVVHNLQFGFLPSETLKLYTGDPVYYEQIPDIISTYFMIKESGLPNFLQGCIPVTSNLNIDRWRFHLLDYWDQQLLDLLEYGFPIDFDWNSALTSTFVNHISALQNVDHVAKYLTEEFQHEAIMGPFIKPPFPIHISPLMTRDKQDSLQKRTIMDLSWPKGLSVNNGVDKDKYLDTTYTLNYPSVDNITASLCKLGPAAQLFKIDISRAFRQIKVDSGDIDLLGIKFDDQYFFDLSAPLGYRHGSKTFQHCTDSFHHIMAKHGFPGLYNYIDDLIYNGLPSKIHLARVRSGHQLQKIGTSKYVRSVPGYID